MWLSRSLQQEEEPLYTEYALGKGSPPGWI